MYFLVKRAEVRRASNTSSLLQIFSATTTLHIVGAVFALVAATALVYSPVRHYAFVSWDDAVIITSNPNIVHGLTWHSVWWALTTTYNGNWIPVTWLSHLLDVTLFGLNPGGAHVTSVIIHLVNVVLLFIVLRRMTGMLARSWCVAALFALHPLHVESVAWVAERKDVLCATGFLLALLAYHSYVTSRRRRQYDVLIGMMCLSAMAKPMVVTLPIVLLLLDVWPLRRITLAPGQWRHWLTLVREKLPLAGVAALISVIAFLAQRRVGAVAQLGVYSLKLRAANAVLSYVRYLGKLCWPVRLAAFYPLPPYIVPDGRLVAAAALTLLGVSVLVVRMAARRPYLLVGWCWYVAMLLPVIGLVQVGDQAMADRFTYLPSIGLFIAATWGVSDVLARVRFGRVLAYASATMAIVLFAAGARAQIGYWQNSLTLWQRSLAVAPSDNFRAHAGIADALMADHRLDEAIAEYREALRILPGSGDVHNDLGVALAKRNQLTDARNEYAAAVRLNQNDPVAHNNLGAMLARQGDPRDAIVEYSASLRLQPAFPQARYNMGLALADAGQLEAGVQACLEALRSDPDHADWQAGVARLYARMGRRADAIEHLKAALAIDPTYQPAQRVLAALEGEQPR